MFRATEDNCICVSVPFCFPSQGPLGRPGLPGADGLPGPPGTVLMLPVSHFWLLRKKRKNVFMFIPLK